MKKLKPLLALLLMFLAGLAVGVVGTRVATRSFIRRAIQNPDLVRNLIEIDLVRKLKLDAVQRIKVHEVLADSQRQLRELRLEFQPRFAPIMDEANDRISAVLTPEQLKKFEKLQEENRRIFPPGPPPERRQGTSP